MKFRRTNGGVLDIADNAVRCMNKYRQMKARDKEAGGIILGRIIDGTNDAVIDEVGTPSSFDRRRRFLFWRAKQPAQDHVNLAWKNSNQTNNYLGEWHTHPEDYPGPSRTDIANWHAILSEALFEQDFLLFIIVGRKSLCVWEMVKGLNTPIELLAHSDSDNVHL